MRSFFGQPNKPLVGAGSLLLIAISLVAACAPVAPVPPPLPPVVAIPTPGSGTGVSAQAAAPTPTATVIAQRQPTPTPGVAAPPKRQEVRVSVPVRGNDNFDPRLEVSFRKVILGLIYDPLVNANQNLELTTQGAVAESWSVNSDSTRFTFKIRRGIKFEDGTDLTARDVKFSLERVLEPDAISTGSSYLRAAIDHVETPDDYTAVVVTKGSRVTLLHPLSYRESGIDGTAIVPKQYVEKAGKDFPIKPMGSGPYKLSQFAIRLRTVLGAWTDKHWAWGDVAIKRFVFLDVPDTPTNIAALRTGAADIIAMPVENKSELEAAGFGVARKPGAFLLSMHMYEQWRPDNPLSNATVRKAMSRAIDRQKILATLSGGEGRVTACHGFLGFTLGCAQDFPPVKYDPAEARKLLAEAGYPKGFNLRFYSYVSSPVDSPVLVQALASMLEATGIKVDIVPQDYSRVLAILRNAQAGNAVSMQNHANLYDMSFLYQAVYNSKGVLAMQKDPAFDALLAGLGGVKTLEDYEKAWRKIQQDIYDNNREVVIAELNALYAFNRAAIAEWTPGRIPSDLNLRGLKLK